MNTELSAATLREVTHGAVRGHCATIHENMKRRVWKSTLNAHAPTTLCLCIANITIALMSRRIIDVCKTCWACMAGLSTLRYCSACHVACYCVSARHFALKRRCRDHPRTLHARRQTGHTTKKFAAHFPTICPRDISQETVCRNKLSGNSCLRRTSPELYVHPLPSECIQSTKP